MSNLIDILRQLESTSGSNDKIAILKNLSSINEEHFKTIAELALSQEYNYYIKEFEMPDVDEYIKESQTDSELIDVIRDVTYQLNERLVSGNAARDYLHESFCELTQDNAEILRRVIKGDLRCKVGAKTVNKVWPGLIYIHPYMQCSSFNRKNLKNINFPCISQTKMDGLYVDLVLQEGEGPIWYSRNHEVLPIENQELIDSIRQEYDNIVIMGELIAYYTNGKMMERAESNGYINSNEVDSSYVKFFVWDVVPYEDWVARKCNQKYKDRLEQLEKLVNSTDQRSNFETVHTAVVNDQDQVIDEFREARVDGEEGTVIKDYEGIWQDKPSKHQVKIKVVFDCDLRVVGWKEGKGKFEGLLGSILMESEDGEIQVSVGGGIKEKERETFLNHIDEWIENGKVACVRANDFSEDENGQTSLFLPRLVEIRNDKSAADSYQKICDQVEAFTNALEAIDKN